MRVDEERPKKTVARAKTTTEAPKAEEESPPAASRSGGASEGRHVVDSEVSPGITPETRPALLSRGTRIKAVLREWSGVTGVTALIIGLVIVVTVYVHVQDLRGKVIEYEEERVALEGRVGALESEVELQKTDVEALKYRAHSFAQRLFFLDCNAMRGKIDVSALACTYPNTDIPTMFEAPFPDLALE